MHHFPGQRDTFQRQGLAWASEQPFAQGRLSTSSAVSPLVRADLWQIFAGLASRAIALKTLFERRARVCLKSNP